MNAPNMEAPDTVAAGRAQGQEQAPADCAAEQADKAFATMRARLALAGYALARTDPADGPPAYFATRWGLVRELRDLDAVADFCRQVGAE